MLARMAYYLSLGFDNSEMPEAGQRSRARLKKLEQRIGPEAFAKFKANDSAALRDPAFWLSGGLPIIIAAIGFVALLGMVCVAISQCVTGG